MAQAKRQLSKSLKDLEKLIPVQFLSSVLIQPLAEFNHVSGAIE
jgi:hypothetical protein